jgi:hypothetical protein
MSGATTKRYSSIQAKLHQVGSKIYHPDQNIFDGILFQFKHFNVKLDKNNSRIFIFSAGQRA